MIRVIANEALAALATQFSTLYSRIGRLSIADGLLDLESGPK
jgi:hypothetical protein